MKSARFANLTTAHHHRMMVAGSLMFSLASSLPFFYLPPPSFASAQTPAQLEQERSEAQKKSDLFFNRKTKSDAEKALLYAQKYRPDLAIGVCVRALIKDAKTDLSKQENRIKLARILTFMGRSFKQDENDRVACFLYRTAGKLDPSDLTNKAFLLESLMLTAQFDEAQKVSKELAASKIDDANALRALANEALINERYDECQKYLDRAIAIKDDPLKHLTYRQMAQCLIRQGIQEKVSDYFRKSAETALSPYESELSFGSAALADNKPQDADEHYQRASRMLPDDIAWQSGRAQSLGLLPNHQKEAIQQALEGVQKRRFTSRSMTLLSNALGSQGDKKSADKVMDRLQKIKFWSWFPFLHRGRIVRNRGDNEGAIKYLEIAQKINPRSSGTAMEMAAAYNNLKMPDKALEICRDKLQLCPRYIQLWILRGSIALQLKHNDEAKDSFEEALRLIPKESSLNVIWKNEAATAHAGLGTLAYQSGDKETAFTEAHEFNELKFVAVLPEWLTIMKFRPNRIDFKSTSKKELEANNHIALADMLLQTRQLKEVVAEYAKAVELNPSDVDLHSYYLNALVENNNWVEAAKEDFILSNKIVGKASDHVAKWVKDNSAKKDAKAAPQGQKDGQGH